MVYEIHEFGRLTEKFARQFSPRCNGKENFGEYIRRKYMTNPTDSSLNFLSHLKSTREKVKTKLATETRRQHARRRPQATFSRRREIKSE